MSRERYFGEGKIGSSKMTARGFVITDFGIDAWTDERVSAVIGTFGIRYVVFQIEIAPTTGREHVQAYIELTKSVRPSFLKGKIGTRNFHVEARRGTREQARGYCMKEETRVRGPWEFGEWSIGGQGARNDLVVLKRDLDGDAPMLVIASNHFGLFLKYRKSIEAYMNLRVEPRSWRTELHILWGTSGSGKSWDAAHAAREGESIYRLRRPVQQGGSLWWDGYTGQEVLIVDEFSGWIPFGVLLTLADEYPLSVEVKGGVTQFLARRIYVTSNLHPKRWYSVVSSDESQWSALDRRVTSCTHYQGRYPQRVIQTAHAVTEDIGSVAAADRFGANEL
jgi:hypothetical protein